MSGLFDWANFLTGQTNPYDEVRDWSDTTQARNRVALGLDANGNPLPPGQPPSPAGGPGAQSAQALQSVAAGQAAATGVMQPAQQPNATKTDPSLGHILVDLQQYQEREQGWNQALGGMGAAISQPRDRDWVRGLFNVNQVDPLKFTQSEMDLAGQQSGMDRGDALSRTIVGPQGAALAQQLGISQQELRARYLADPQGVGTMIANFSSPTEATKNYNQARAQMKAQGMTDEQINAVMPPEMLALGGVSDPGYREFVLARTRAIQNGQALSPELQDYPTYQASKAAKAKLATDNAADLSDAQGKLAPLNQRIDETNTIVDRIKSNRKLDVALTYLTTTGGAGAAAAAKSGMIDRQTYQAIQDIQQLSGQVYGEGFSSTGSKRTQQEVAAIVSGLSQLKATGMSAQDYIDQALNPLQSHLQRGKANAFGAAGSLDDLSPELHMKVDPIYLPGGRLYAGAGGEWARPIDVSDPKELARLQKGQAYRIKSGPYAGVHWVGFKDDGTPTS